MQVRVGTVPLPHEKTNSEAQEHFFWLCMLLSQEADLQQIIVNVNSELKSCQQLQFQINGNF